MNTIKKIVSVLIGTAMIMAFATGCSSAASAGTQTSEAGQEKELSIVTTTFPIYNWVSEILGDTAENASLTMLENSGVDLHSYQPTAADIIEISNCDVFIYVGGESDSWVEAALEKGENPDRVVINLLEVLGNSSKTEEVIEGMQEEEHDHDTEEEHEDDHDHDHEEESEVDEHVWLSLKNAQIFVQDIAQELSAVNASDANIYQQNAQAYVAELSLLDEQYQAMVDSSEYKTVLFGDRFPFRYLVDDYGLTYYAAFVGCSAETEASFETISFLATKLQELGLPAVLTIEGSDKKIAQTIINNTSQKDQEILTMNSMQSVTENDVKNGVTYLSIMQSNMDVLEKALNKGDA